MMVIQQIVMDVVSSVCQKHVEMELYRHEKHVMMETPLHMTDVLTPVW